MAIATRSEPESTIHGLRRKVDDVMSEQVTPTVKAAADRAEEVVHRVAARAEDYADRVTNVSRREVDLWSDRVRDRPLTSVALAGVAGFLIARLMPR